MIQNNQIPDPETEFIKESKVPEKFQISFLKDLLKISMDHVTDKGIAMLKMIFGFVIILFIIWILWKTFGN